MSQVKVLTGAIGFEEGRVKFLHTWIDQLFFRIDAPPPVPAKDAPPKVFPAPGSYALAIGMESRDYPTLQRAMALPQFSHITMHVVASGWSPGAGYSRASGISDAPNISVSSGYTSEELRMLYAGARLVVVPLNEVTYAAGVTGILEGMSMSKAVVASDSPGIRDYTREGKCGAVVPCHDADALGAAIATLWDNPTHAGEIGEENRRWVEAMATTDLYAENVATLTGRR
jgi:glycosyltransferase involved in cell wall biosynthesis